MKLDPNSIDALTAKAALAGETGNYADAIAAYSTVIGKQPDSVTALAGRGIVYARKGDAAAATRDFDQARSKATNPVLLNNLCWQKATAGISLDSALKDCDSALAPNPTVAGFLDSRGLVMLRLGRLDDAIADYTKALSTNPHLAGSRFGRGVAYLRKGDAKDGADDIATAKKDDADIETQFAQYGIAKP